MSEARSPDAWNESSPPLAFTTSRSLVPMSKLKGSGGNTVEAHAGAVRRGR
jgi:hypothetical protein